MAEPFVTILRDSGRPELWLVTRDAQGCIRPAGTTGPVRLPPEWEAEMVRATGVEVLPAARTWQELMASRKPCSSCVTPDLCKQHGCADDDLAAGVKGDGNV